MPPYLLLDDRVMLTILDEKEEVPMDEENSGSESVPGPEQPLAYRPGPCDDGTLSDAGSNASFRRPGEKKRVSTGCNM